MAVQFADRIKKCKDKDLLQKIMLNKATGNELESFSKNMGFNNKQELFSFVKDYSTLIINLKTKYPEIVYAEKSVRIINDAIVELVKQKKLVVVVDCFTRYLVSTAVCFANYEALSQFDQEVAGYILAGCLAASSAAYVSCNIR